MPSIGYAVATAYSNQPTATVLKTSAVDAFSAALDQTTTGTDYKPVYTSAVAVQDPDPVPPTSGGEQLSFYWG